MKPYQPTRLPLESIDWSALVTLIGQANAGLARYDGMLQGIVNPGVMLSPLTTQEAVLSSRIEGTQASMEEVLEYEASPQDKIEPEKRDDIREIINYRRAMVKAVREFKKRPLCLNLIKEMHVVLLDSVRGRHKAPGEFRRVQNYIGPPGCDMDTATFVPPSVDQMGPALDNWEKYCHSEEKDRLVQLAVLKAQFELIHPFLDGNGRIGRILIPLFLFEKGLLSSPMFYLSAYLDEHRDEYYERLRAISRQQDWNGWIQFFLTAVREQAGINAEKTRNILALYDRMKVQVQEAIRSQYIIQAIDALFAQPIFTSIDFSKRSKIPKESSYHILSVLKKEGIVKEHRPGRGRRGSVLIFQELIDITEK
jgi:Fic family protein